MKNKNSTKTIWHSTVWTRPKEGTWTGAMGGIVWPSEFVIGIIGDVNYGTLFTYMFRRFGIPEYGSDDYKEIAKWFITTPDSDVALIVSPRPSGVKCSFGYYTRKYGAGNEKKIELALKAAMKDLLVTTSVQDIYINAAGRVKDGDFEIVEYSKWAGYGVNHKYFEDRFKR